MCLGGLRTFRTLGLLRNYHRVIHATRGGAPMETTLQPARPGWEHRLQAVLALISGEPIPQVTARFGMGRSILYKWRHRALTALQGALTDHHHGPQCPANRLSPAQEHPLVELPT